MQAPDHSVYGTPLCRQDDADQRAEEAGVDVKTLSRYFRAHRREVFANKKLNKFSEACWRDLIYAAAIVCAVAYVMPQEWFKNLEECWCVE